jgi:hypothetical protein
MKIFQRARYRLRPPLQHPYHPRPGLPPDRRIRTHRVGHALCVHRVRYRLRAPLQHPHQSRAGLPGVIPVSTRSTGLSLATMVMVCAVRAVVRATCPPEDIIASCEAQVRHICLVQLTTTNYY